MKKIIVAKSITSAAKIETAIQKAKESLIKKAKKSGIYENFGQAEADAIENKHIEFGNFYDEMLRRKTQLKNFRDWCANYDITEQA